MVGKKKSGRVKGVERMEGEKGKKRVQEIELSCKKINHTFNQVAIYSEIIVNTKKQLL